MRVLLVLALILWVLTYVTYKNADRPGDDFGAGVVPVFCAVASIVLTLAYVGMALFEHRLW